MAASSGRSSIRTKRRRGLGQDVEVVSLINLIEKLISTLSEQETEIKEEIRRLETEVLKPLSPTQISTLDNDKIFEKEIRHIIDNLESFKSKLLPPAITPIEDALPTAVDLAANEIQYSKLQEITNMESILPLTSSETASSVATDDPDIINLSSFGDTGPPISFAEDDEPTIEQLNPLGIIPGLDNDIFAQKTTNEDFLKRITSDMEKTFNQIIDAKIDAIQKIDQSRSIPYFRADRIISDFRENPILKSLINEKYEQMIALRESLKANDFIIAILFAYNIAERDIYIKIVKLVPDKVMNQNAKKILIDEYNTLIVNPDTPFNTFNDKYLELYKTVQTFDRSNPKINFLTTFLQEFIQNALVPQHSEIFWYEEFISAFGDSVFLTVKGQRHDIPQEKILDILYKYSKLKYEISEVISMYTGDNSVFINFTKLGKRRFRPKLTQIKEIFLKLQTLVEEKQVEVNLDNLKDDLETYERNLTTLETKLLENKKEFEILKARDETLDAESGILQEREKTIAGLGAVIANLTEITALQISSSKSKGSSEYIDLDKDISEQIARYQNPPELFNFKVELLSMISTLQNKKSKFVAAFGYLSSPFKFIQTLNDSLKRDYLSVLNDSTFEDQLKSLLLTNPNDKLIVLLNLYVTEFKDPDTFKHNEEYWYDQLYKAVFALAAKSGTPSESYGSSSIAGIDIDRRTIDEFVRTKQKAVKRIREYKQSLVDAQITNISELKKQLAVIQSASINLTPFLDRMERLKEQSVKLGGEKLQSLNLSIFLAEKRIKNLKQQEEAARVATEKFANLYKSNVAEYIDTQITQKDNPELRELRNKLVEYDIDTILQKLAAIKQKEDERGAYLEIASDTINRINETREQLRKDAYVEGMNSIKGSFDELSAKLSADVLKTQTEVDTLLKRVNKSIADRTTLLEELDIQKYTTELQQLLTGVGVVVSELKLSPDSTLNLALGGIQSALKNLSSSNLTETQLTDIITRTYDSKIRPSVSAFEKFMNDFNSRGYSTREDIQRMLNTYLSNQKNEIENIVQLMIKNDPEIQNIFKTGTQSMDKHMLELRNKLHQDLTELITKADSSILTPERVKGVLSNSIIEAMKTDPNMAKMVQMAQQSRQPITQSQLKFIIDSQKQEMERYYKPLFDAMQAKFSETSKTTLTQDQAFTFFYDSFNSFLRTDPRIKLLLDTLSTGTSNGITEEKFKELIKNVLQEETGSRNKAYEDIKTDLIEALKFQLSQFQPPTLSSETVKNAVSDEIVRVIEEVQMSNKTNYNAILTAIRQIPSPTLDTSKVSAAVSSQISKLVTQIETSNMEKYNKILSTISSPTIDVKAINRGVSAKVSNLINEIKTSNDRTHAAILDAISRPTLSTDEVSNAVYSKITELVNQIKSSNNQNNTAILDAIQKITPPAITSDMIKEASETAIKNAMSEIVSSIDQLKTSEQVDRQNIISTFEQLQKRGYAELQSRIERLLVSNDSILRELVGNTNAMLAQSKNAEQRTVDDIHGIRESINRLEKYYKSMMKINAHPEQNKRLKDISEKAHKVFGEVDPKVRHPHLKDIVDISKQYRDTSERHKENLRLYMHRRMQKKTPVLEDTTAESSFRSKSRRTMSARTDDSSSFDPSYEEERSIEESDFLDDDIPVMGKTVQRTQTRLPQPPPQSEPQEHAVVPITLWKRSLSQLVDILDGGDPFGVYDDVMRHIAADDVDMKEIMDLFKRFTQDVEGLVGKPRGAFCDPNLNFVEKYAREVLKTAAELLPSLELRDLMNPKKKEELIAHARPIVEIAVKRRTASTLSQVINSDVSPALMHTVGKYIFELPYQTSYSFIDSSSHENIVESISRGVVENMVVGHTSGEHMKLPTPTSVRKYLDQQLESRDVSRDVMDIFRPLVDQPFFSAFLTSLQHIDYDARRDASMALLKSRLESTIFKQLVGACYNFNSTVSNRFSSAIVQRQAGDRLGVFIDIARKHFMDSYVELKPTFQATVSPFQLSRRGQRR